MVPDQLFHIAGLVPIWPAPCGIYFLVRGGVVVYVGKSRSPHIRVPHHTKSKKFDQVFCQFCDEEDLDRHERFYIERFKPEYNLAIPGVPRKNTGRCTLGSNGYVKWFEGKTRWVCNASHTADEAEVIWRKKKASIRAMRGAAGGPQ